MSQTPVFDPSSRPNYWDPADALAAILGNVKGHRRREMIEDIITGRAAELAAAAGYDEAIQAALSEVDPTLLADELEDPNALGWVDPTFLGGEFLPPYLPGEVEIARLTLYSTTMDVYAIRARQRARCIRYRVLDEYDTEWKWRPRTSRLPLTFGEIVGLIDSLDDGGRNGDGPDYLTWVWEFDVDWIPTAAELEETARFIAVSSPFYPDLGAYYERRAQEWVRRRCREFGHERTA